MNLKVGDTVRLVGKNWGSKDDPYATGVYEGSEHVVTEIYCNRGWIVSPGGDRVLVGYEGWQAEPVGDPVNSPSHYVRGGMEAIDVIYAFGLDKNYALGNVAKYLLRAGYKENAKQDLQKAAWYLAKAIGEMEE